ncbi:unnamed protein product [Dicrocoelium dendriticum]|nr:unnamed protein product [Dicrocoelium dendriticum]
MAYALSCNPPQDVEQPRTCIGKAMTISGQSSCGLTRRSLKAWILARSLELFERRKDIPAESDCNERRRSANQMLKQTLRKDRERWWPERVLEMETAALSGNTRRLFQLIRSTGLRNPGVREVICEVIHRSDHQPTEAYGPLGRALSIAVQLTTTSQQYIQYTLLSTLARPTESTQRSGSLPRDSTLEAVQSCRLRRTSSGAVQVRQRGDQ